MRRGGITRNKNNNDNNKSCNTQQHAPVLARSESRTFGQIPRSFLCSGRSPPINQAQRPLKKGNRNKDDKKQEYVLSVSTSMMVSAYFHSTLILLTPRPHLLVLFLLQVATYTPLSPTPHTLITPLSGKSTHTAPSESAPRSNSRADGGRARQNTRMLPRSS